LPGDYSTPRVQRFRGHYAGDHSMCSLKCPDALDAHNKRQVALRAKAIFDECARQRLDPAPFLDDVPAALAAVAELGEEPDIVSRLAARAEIKLRPSADAPADEPELAAQILEDDEPGWLPRQPLPQSEHNERW
jgi:hypothetical protein